MWQVGAIVVFESTGKTKDLESIQIRLNEFIFTASRSTTSLEPNMLCGRGLKEEFVKVDIKLFYSPIVSLSHYTARKGHFIPVL